MTLAFDYDSAFSRNIGWTSEGEQARLRASRVAIAGMGGVGGFHLQTLSRLGIGNFHLSDMDRFELANFNRQAGASMETIDRSKVEVMAASAKAINPDLALKIFDKGVNEDNLEAFLDGVDLYVDGLDFFVLDIRRKIFARCRELGIPAITAAPLGMGSAYLIFMPDGMSFEDYFRLEGLSEDKQYVNFALGVGPSGFHRGYVDSSYINFAEKRGPSTVMACQICAGVTAVEALKILLGRGNVRAAPWYHHFDPYRAKWKRGRLWWGNANPVQRLKLAVAYRIAEGMKHKARARNDDVEPANDIEAILDIARWAPSGDNTQPWRFKISGTETVEIHLTSPGDVYDFNHGQPTFLSVGLLLETMTLAASGFGRACRWQYRNGPSGHNIIVEFPKDAHVEADPLRYFIRGRSVERGAMRTTSLDEDMKARLAACLPDDVQMSWFEERKDRQRMAFINARTSDIRLRLKSAFDVHRRIIDWENRFSQKGIPGAALGLDPLTQRMTRFLMGDWRKMDLMNRYMGGTWLAALQMDIIPGLRCGAHFAVSLKDGKAAELSPERLMQIGAGLQRFWLTATKLGLKLQPSLAPLCFAHYGRSGELPDASPALHRKMDRLVQQLDGVVGNGAAVVFMGRLGAERGVGQAARSLRLPLKSLLVDEADGISDKT